MDAFTPPEIKARAWMNVTAEVLKARLFTIGRHMSDLTAVRIECIAVVERAGLGRDRIDGAFVRLFELYSRWHDATHHYRLITEEHGFDHDLGSFAGLAMECGYNIFEIANILSEAETRLGSAASRKTDPFKPIAEQQSAISARALALGLHAIIVNAAVSFFLLVQSVTPSLPDEDKSSDRARQRRLRDRKRLGIVGQVPVNLFRSDIAILRTLGFLAAAEADDKEAQSRAIENFIAASILTRVEPQVPRRHRWESQKGRMEQLGLFAEHDEWFHD